MTISGFYVTGLHDKSMTLQQYWNLVRAVLTACPPWLRYTVAVLWAYGLYGAVASMNLSFEPTPKDESSQELATLSGGLMMLYSISLAMLYPSTDDRRKVQIDRARNPDVDA